MSETILTDEKLLELYQDYIANGSINERDLGVLLTSCRNQRDVLKTLFGFWIREPLKLVYYAHAVRRHTLDELKRRVALEHV